MNTIEYQVGPPLGGAVHERSRRWWYGRSGWRRRSPNGLGEHTVASRGAGLTYERVSFLSLLLFFTGTMYSEKQLGGGRASHARLKVLMRIAPTRGWTRTYSDEAPLLVRGGNYSEGLL
jgi:hypothetical protein